MRLWLFRWCVDWAWSLVPSDWVWYADKSLERNIYECIRSASIDLERLETRLGWERIEKLRNKGTQ